MKSSSDVSKLFSKFRSLNEGDVLQFPQKPKLDREDLDMVIALESKMHRLLDEVYGDTFGVPLDIMKKVDEVVNMVEQSLLDR